MNMELIIAIFGPISNYFMGTASGGLFFFFKLCLFFCPLAVFFVIGRNDTLWEMCSCFPLGPPPYGDHTGAELRIHADTQTDTHSCRVETQGGRGHSLVILPLRHRVAPPRQPSPNTPFLAHPSLCLLHPLA